MSDVLYRKYRPQFFSEVSGQNHIKTILVNEVLSGQIAHAYLFCGPRGVGKTTLARILAKALNCSYRSKEQAEPCNKCSSCLAINSNNSLDILEIDAASNTGVDNVRDNIIAAARVTSSSLSHKVFIIDEVHMLSVSAFNALLKTLEEPPRGVVFILCTTEIHKMPATIISRCQRFDFKKISSEDIAAKLSEIASKEGVDIEYDILLEIARTSGGHMRDAESLFNQILAVSEGPIKREEVEIFLPRNNWSEVWRLIVFLLKKDATGAISLINRLADDGVEMFSFNKDLLEALRALLLSNFDCQSCLSEVWAAKDEVDKNWEYKPTVSEIKFLIKLFLESGSQVKSSFLPQLPLEMAIIEACLVQTTSTKVFVESQAKKKMVVEDGGFGNDMPLIGDTEDFSNTPGYDLKSVNDDSGFEAANSLSTNIVHSDAGYTLDNNSIINRWGDFLVEIKKQNPSLSFILKVCEPRGVENNSLNLAIKYKFHKDRIEEPHIRDLIERVLKEVYGASLRINALVDTNFEQIAVAHSDANSNAESNIPSQVDKGDQIDDILQTLGGKVVS